MKKIILNRNQQEWEDERIGTIKSNQFEVQK